MRTIVHISDLHFGRINTSLLAPLHAIIDNRETDVVVISGDITQRAKQKEFKAARDFIASLNVKVFLVPGNHDIPLYRFWERLLRPYKKYIIFISETLEPRFRDEELTIVGINSSRPYRAKNGQVTATQLNEMSQAFLNVPGEMIKIVVAHHSWYVPKTIREKPLGRAHAALKYFEQAKVDLLLTGHLHVTWTEHPGTAYKISPRGPLFVPAGTALSTRLRSELNSFNIITTSPDQITIERYEHHEGEATFLSRRSEQYKRTSEGWTRNTKTRTSPDMSAL